MRASPGPNPHARSGSTAIATLVAAVLATLASSATGQLQFDPLRKRALPPDDDATQALALGDVDGDGAPDVVVGNVGGKGRREQNRLYLNGGGGIYADVTPTRMPADGDDTRAVAMGDVDGDGDLDIVWGNMARPYDGAQNRLYLNDGTGRYADATATHLPSRDDRTLAVVLGDVDADGDLDLVIGNTQEQNRIYVNDGTGRYTDETSARLPADADQTFGLALGDLDNDGDLDLLVANRVSARATRLYVNDGTGIYVDQTPGRLPIPLEDANAAAVGDVDGDGDLDILLGGDRRAHLFVNDGSGIFADATSTRMPAATVGLLSLAFGDVDGDGDLDAVAGGAPATGNRLYVNDGAGTYADASGRLPASADRTAAIAFGDVDGDGDLDVACGNADERGYGRYNRLYLNDAAGNFVDATGDRMPVVVEPVAAVALGDVDGDGDVDLLLANATGARYPSNRSSNRLYLNDGAGAFSDATSTRLPPDQDDSLALAVADVDIDGDLDILFGNGGFRGGQDRLYLNDGTGTFVDATATRLPRSISLTSAMAVGDVDGDGDVDLLATDRLHLNDGTGTFSGPASGFPRVPDRVDAVVLGDVDADGDLDVVFGTVGPRNGGALNRLYRNDGAGTFTDVTATSLPPDADETRSLALGDVDGDGDLDLVCGNHLFSGQQSRLYLNDGAGVYTDVTAARLPARPASTNAVALVDVDADGDLDLVLANEAVLPRSNLLWNNDGTGTFTDASATVMPPQSDNTMALAVGDVDDDGDPDLVFGNDRTQTELLVGLRRQLDAPLLLLVARSYTLRIYSRYGPPGVFDAALPLLSTTRASIPVPPFGILRLDPRHMVVLSPVLVPQPAGVGSVDLAVPNVPALAGLQLHAQALLVRYPFERRLTNVASETLVR